MASNPVTEDYYRILKVLPTSTPEVITRSYKRLALKFHPDKNPAPDATEVFQQLLRAYETLKDETKRQTYDRYVYPSIRRAASVSTQQATPAATSRSQQATPAPTARSQRATPTPATQPASAPRPEVSSEAALIAALEELKRDRAARWWVTRRLLEAPIFELKTIIRQLEKEIENLNFIAAAEAAAEAAEEAKRNGWKAWILAPFYNKVEIGEEEKSRNERAKQERMIERDLKERRLTMKKEELTGKSKELNEAKARFNLANLLDDGNLEGIRERIRKRELMERHQREVRERMAEMVRREREKCERAAAQRPGTEQEEDQARKEEAYAYRRGSGSICHHEIWPGKWMLEAKGRAYCPECSHFVGLYILECSDCGKRVCPKCQANMSERLRREKGTAEQSGPSSSRTFDSSSTYYGTRNYYKYT